MGGPALACEGKTLPAHIQCYGDAVNPQRKEDSAAIRCSVQGCLNRGAVVGVAVSSRAEIPDVGFAAHKRRSSRIRSNWQATVFALCQAEVGNRTQQDDTDKYYNSTEY